MKGQYIVIEGGDGTGKTTVAQKIAQELISCGQEVVLTHEPGGNQIAEAIRDVIKDGTMDRQAITNLPLFTASRAETWATIIKPALEAGKTVISSRNWFSSWVYQGYAEKLGTDYVEELSKVALNQDYLWPDKVVILTLDQKTREQRIKSRDDNHKTDTFEMRDDYFQQKLNDGYIKLAQKFDLPVVDASQSKQAVFEQVLKIVE